MAKQTQKKTKPDDNQPPRGAPASEAAPQQAAPAENPEMAALAQKNGELETEIGILREDNVGLEPLKKENAELITENERLEEVQTADNETNAKLRDELETLKKLATPSDHLQEDNLRLNKEIVTLKAGTIHQTGELRREINDLKGEHCEKISETLRQVETLQATEEIANEQIRFLRAELDAQKVDNLPQGVRVDVLAAAAYSRRANCSTKQAAREACEIHDAIIAEVSSRAVTKGTPVQETPPDAPEEQPQT